MQRYMAMAASLESDWVPLARQLGIGDRDVLRIQLDHVDVTQQAAAALRLWARAAVTRSNGSELEAALRHIGRLDIVQRYFAADSTEPQQQQQQPGEEQPVAGPPAAVILDGQPVHSTRPSAYCHCYCLCH